MRELALFAGAGGSVLAGRLLGWRTACAVEIDDWARATLLRRQRDGALGRFPIWDDVRTFDGAPWRRRIDVVTGGFPCQDISASGGGQGLDGARSGLWTEMARIIREVRPIFAFVENSPLLARRGIERVLGDLAEIGFHAEWEVFSAKEHAGCCHLRERMFILAYADGVGLEGVDVPQYPVAYPEKSRRRQFERAVGAALSEDDYSGMYRDPDVLAEGMDRLRTIGNGWVPPVAVRAWCELLQRVAA